MTEEYAANYNLKFGLRRALLQQADAADNITDWVKRGGNEFTWNETNVKTPTCADLDADIISEMEHASDRAREIADAIGVELRACDCRETPLNWCTDNHAGYQNVLKMLYDMVERAIDGGIADGNSYEVIMIDPTDKETGITSCNAKGFPDIAAKKPGSYLDPENKKGLILGTIHNFSDEAITDTCFFDEVFNSYATKCGLDTSDTDSLEYDAVEELAIHAARAEMKRHILDIIAFDLWGVLAGNWCPPYNPDTDSRKKNGGKVCEIMTLSELAKVAKKEWSARKNYNA